VSLCNEPERRQRTGPGTGLRQLPSASVALTPAIPFTIPIRVPISIPTTVTIGVAGPISVSVAILIPPAVPHAIPAACTPPFPEALLAWAQPPELDIGQATLHEVGPVVALPQSRPSRNPAADRHKPVDCHTRNCPAQAAVVTARVAATMKAPMVPIYVRMACFLSVTIYCISPWTRVKRQPDLPDVELVGSRPQARCRAQAGALHRRDVGAWRCHAGVHRRPLGAATTKTCQAATTCPAHGEVTRSILFGRSLWRFKAVNTWLARAWSC